MSDEISVAALKRKMDSGEDFILLDVREPDEVLTAKVAPSLHIPMGQIQSRVAELPLDKEIAVMCHHGARSERVTRYLRANGFEKAVNVAGGIDAWSVEIDPSVPRY